MAKDGIIVPILYEIEKEPFRGSVNELFDYMVQQGGKSVDQLGSLIEKKTKKRTTRYKQLLVQMADGSYSSVLANITQDGKIRKGKRSIKVTGGLHKDQLSRFTGAQSIDDYNTAVKTSRREMVFFQKLGELTRAFEKIKKDPSGESLERIKSKVSEHKNIAQTMGYPLESVSELETSIDTYSNKFAQIGKDLNEILYKSSSVYTKQKMDLDRVTESLEKAKEKFKQYREAGLDTKDVEKEIKSLNKELSKLGKQPPLNGIQKFINTIKRVGFYRVARNLFRFIEQGFGQATQNLIEIDDRVNNTMSKLSTATERMSASVALILLPAFQVIEPLVTDISLSMADFANKVSEASAQMAGLSEYTRISDEFMKDLRNTANSLSFDKFESLNGTISPYEKGQVDKSKDLSKYTSVIIKTRAIANSIIEIIRNIISFVKELFSVIAPHASDLFALLQNTVLILTSLVLGITNIIVKITQWASANGSLEGTLWGILGVIVAIKAVKILAGLKAVFVFLGTNLLPMLGKCAIEFGKFALGVIKTAKANGMLSASLTFITAFILFDKILSNAPKWVSAIVAVAGAVATLAVAFLALTHQWSKAIALPALALSAGIAIAGFKNSIQAYANGGMVESGSLFVAGEAGAELVTTMPSGKTGVTNIAQFKQAMVEAIYECSDVFQQADGSVVLNLDGAQIARSKNFKNELNRTNAGLNLR